MCQCSAGSRVRRPPAQSRPYLRERLRQDPALLPHEMAQGFPLHDASVSVTQAVLGRRMKLQTTGAVFTLRPAVGMPEMMARPRGRRRRPLPAAVGGPYDALASPSRTAALCSDQAWRACGGPALRGTPRASPAGGPPRSEGRSAS